MGAFFTNYHVRTADKAACDNALRGLIRLRAMVTDPENGWVTIYDEGSESQNIKELRRLGKGLSSKLNTSVLCVMVHDSDIFVYLLYEDGKRVDQFDSCPDYFGPVTAKHRKEWAGNIEALMKLAPEGSTSEQIRKILSKRQMMEEERALEFGAFLGIDPHRARMGFKYAQKESHSDYSLVYGRKYSALDAELAEAVSKRDNSAVKDLLQKGASPDQYDSLGRPLIVSAIQRGAIEIAEALVGAGADVLAEGKQLKGDAIWIASAEGQSKILELLLARARGDKRLQNSLRVAFSSAVLFGHLEAIRLLLDAGADVNQTDEKGNSPLMYASIKGSEGEYERRNQRPYPEPPGRLRSDWPEIVEVLLKAGANPNLQSHEGVTPLMGAAARGLSEICRLLIRVGADVNLKTKNGLTALAIARATGHGSLEEILQSGAPGASGTKTEE